MRKRLNAPTFVLPDPALLAAEERQRTVTIDGVTLSKEQVDRAVKKLASPPLRPGDIVALRHNVVPTRFVIVSKSVAADLHPETRYSRGSFVSAINLVNGGRVLLETSRLIRVGRGRDLR